MSGQKHVLGGSAGCYDLTPVLLEVMQERCRVLLGRGVSALKNEPLTEMTASWREQPMTPRQRCNITHLSPRVRGAPASGLEQTKPENQTPCHATTLLHLRTRTQPKTTVSWPESPSTGTLKVPDLSCSIFDDDTDN